MRLSPLAVALVAAALATPAPAPCAAPADDYAAMLAYLANSRIDGRAFAGANGAIAANLAAGDLNLQANLRGIANGQQADVAIAAVQSRAGNRFNVPLHAAASIGGQAFEGASGLVSINQTSGSGNAGVNLVAAILAADPAVGPAATANPASSLASDLSGQGFREASDDSLLALAAAARDGQPTPGVPGNGSRRVAVEAGAMRGFEGVMQLNQIAGAGNLTSNQLGLSVQPVP